MSLQAQYSLPAGGQQTAAPSLMSLWLPVPRGQLCFAASSSCQTAALSPLRWLAVFHPLELKALPPGNAAPSPGLPSACAPPSAPCLRGPIRARLPKKRSGSCLCLCPTFSGPGTVPFADRGLGLIVSKADNLYGSKWL